MSKRTHGCRQSSPARWRHDGCRRNSLKFEIIEQGCTSFFTNVATHGIIAETLRTNKNSRLHENANGCFCFYRASSIICRAASMAFCSLK